MEGTKMKRFWLLAAACLFVNCAAWAQTSQKTKITGNTEINVNTDNTTAIAAGTGNVARNRIGVVQGNIQGNTHVTVNAANVTTVVGGRNKKACTNIGSIVNDDCK
jgi:hypothetical protein